MTHKYHSNHRLSQKAQSLIEYTLITVLVMTGIFVMGPYVIRSVNSYFKFTEDSVKDSFMEDIRQAPPTTEEFPTCDCGAPTGACGNGTTTCLKTQEHWSRTCNPVGCEVSILGSVYQPKGNCVADNNNACCTEWSGGGPACFSECRFNDPFGDLRCCTDWVNNGCGAGALWSNTSASGTEIFINDEDPLQLGDVDTLSDWDIDGKCLNGYMQQVRDCGSPTTIKEYRCIPTPACNYNCAPPANVNYFLWCVVPQRPAMNNQAIVYVDNPGDCDGTPCQAHCTGDLVPTADTTACICPPFVPQMDQIPNTNQCLCPSGFVQGGECPAGQCESKADVRDDCPIDPENPECTNEVF